MLGSAFAALVTGEIADIVTRVKRLTISYLLIGIFGAIGLGFLIAAGYIRLEREIGPLYAALAIGGGFLVLAIIVFIWESATSKRQAKKFTRRNNTEMKRIAITTGLTILPLVLRSRMGPSLLALPALAAAAAAIYRENGRRTRRPPARFKD